MGKQGSSGKGNKRVKSEGQRSYALAKKIELAASNPFDKFSNARKKHEVVNRRVKGEDRNVGRAREKAVEERRRRLLGEYQTSKKMNVFEDKRFGESDTNMSLEDKMFMRFQKEKVKKARNLQQYNLDANDDNEVLTHRGQALGASNIADDDVFSEDDDGGLDKEVVNNLHFGGGLVRKDDEAVTAASHSSGSGNNHLDALQEIVMKSKLAKMERKEAKEDQESGRLMLDDAFAEIMKESLLDVNPQGRDKTEVKKDEEARLGSADFLGYDQALRGMAFESRAAATDRTKSAEELALEERERLEEAEEERVRRMRGEPAQPGKDDDDDDDDGDDDNDDDDDDNDEDEDGEDGDEEDGEDEDDDDDGEDEKDDNDVDAGSEQKRSDRKRKSVSFQDATSTENYITKPQGKSPPLGSLSAKSAPNASRVSASVGGNSSKSKEVSAEEAITNDEMPHVLPCPQDMEQFEDLVEKYCRYPADLVSLVSRIAAYHSVHLPGSVGQDNKALMHNFLDILLRYFCRVGDSLADASAKDRVSQDTVLGQLDGLTTIIYNLTVDLGDRGASLWGRTLRTLHKQLQKRLRDYAQGVRETCWPSLGRLLFFRLLAHVFPVTDFRHALVTPATLFLAQCLSQCPVSSAADLVSGVYTCCLLSDVYCEGTQRFVPEVTHYLTLLLSLLDGNKKPPLTIPWHVFATENPGTASEKSFMTSAIANAAITLSESLVKKHAESQALPEMFTPLSLALSNIRWEEAVVSGESVKRALDDVQQNRQPLRWRESKVESIELKTPRYELNYTFKKDRDPDADRAKLKQLTRQSKRETKAAMRELRRDAEFLDQHAYAAKQEAHEARRAERAKNFAFMEQQQATMNMQVKTGNKGNVVSGGGSAAVKRARVKRK
eukprot:GSChrysophyteH1.ASY1.ANO1.1128.1 assembled CDS